MISLLTISFFLEVQRETENGDENAVGTSLFYTKIFS